MYLLEYHSDLFCQGQPINGVVQKNNIHKDTSPGTWLRWSSLRTILLPRDLHSYMKGSENALLNF